MRIVILITTLLFNSYAFGFLPNQPSANGLSGAYGYLYGQEERLKNIESKFPELAGETALVKVKFNQAYPNALAEVNKQLITLFGEEDANKIKESIKSKAIQSIESSPIDKNGAIAFLQNVEKRAEGNIEPLETKRFISAATYHDQPALEMLKMTQKYESKDSPKSKGVNLSVRVPFSWLAKQSDHPNTLISWSADAGTGPGYASVIIQDAKGKAPTAADLKRMAQQKAIADLGLPKDSVVTKYSYTEISSRPALYVTYELPVSRLGQDFYSSNTNLFVIDGDKLVLLGCSNGGEKSDIKKIRAESQRLEKVCTLFFNSLVIQNKTTQDSHVGNLSEFLGGTVWKAKESTIMFKDRPNLKQAPDCETHFIRAEHISICKTPEGEVTTSYDQVCTKDAPNKLICESTLGFSTKNENQVGKKSKIEYLKHLETLTTTAYPDRQNEGSPVKVITVYSLIKK